MVIGLHPIVKPIDCHHCIVGPCTPTSNKGAPWDLVSIDGSMLPIGASGALAWLGTLYA